MSKYHVQLVKCQRGDDGRLTPIRDPLMPHTKYVVVEAANLLDANDQACKIAKSMGNWMPDGHAQKSGSQVQN